MTTQPEARSHNLRSIMEQFIEERRTAKLDKLKKDDLKENDLKENDLKREAVIEQHRFDNWVSDAARRAKQLQVVTHSLKAIHPDAKGTNLFVPPNKASRSTVVGTHVLGSDAFEEDVVGNAAALDVYKFLKCSCDGKTLLDRVREDDPELKAAFSKNSAQAAEWMEAFASITQPPEEVASHTLAKQIYWLVGDDPTDDQNFHLLAPLHATTLTHRVHQTIQEDRYGDNAKEARQARRAGIYSEHEVHEHLNLATQKFGGTKPQNISQLNSERGGNNYLLASLPPTWVSRAVREPLSIQSIFDRFRWRPGVRELVQEMRRFLLSDPEPTMETREHRDEFVDALIDELIFFVAELRTLEPGWSEKPDCNLPEAQQFWLDPLRVQWDEAFANKREREAGSWPESVRHTFANWLNAELKSLPMGDIEHAHWKKQLDGQLDALQEALPHV